MSFLLNLSSRRHSWPALALSLLALPILLQVSGATAAVEAPLSLQQTRLLARENAPRVMASMARITAAREDAARASELPDPVLSLAIDNLSISGPEAFNLGGDFMTMRRLGLMQDWPSRRKRDAQRELAWAQTELAEAEADATVAEVERMAGEAWFAVWAAERDQTFLDQLVLEWGRLIDIAQARLSSGNGSAAAILQARSAEAEFQNERRMAQMRVEAARAELVRWLGEPGRRPLADLPSLDRLPHPSPRLRGEVDRQAALLPWSSRQRAAEAALQLAEADKRPDLGFAVSYGARSAGLPDMAMFEVRVGLPLFPRQRQDRAIAARAAEREAVAADYQDARRQQQETIDRALAEWQALSDVVARLYNTQLPLARDQAALALAGYRNGADLDDWLDAQRALIDTQRQTLRAQFSQGRVWLLLATLFPSADSASGGHQ